MALARPLCYLASPLGFTEAGRDYYYSTYVPALARVVEPVDPWALTSAQELAAAYRDGTIQPLLREIGARNRRAIEASSLLVAYLEGQELDAGTVAELGFAAGRGRRCYGLRSDLREHGERGGLVNLQVQTFIDETGGRMARSLGELVQALAVDYPPPGPPT